MSSFLRRLALGAAALGLALTAACSSGATPVGATGTDPTVAENVSFPAGSPMARIHDAGTIRIGTKFDQPLFGQLNPVAGSPQGFDVEIGKIIAADLGIPADKIEWVETVSANREPFLQQNRVDLVIATYTINDKRKEVIDFGGPYYVAGQSLTVAAGNPKAINGPQDTAGTKVCSVEGSASSTNLRDLVPGVELVLFDSYSKCADALKNGQADAVTTDNTILAGLRSLDPDAFELVDTTFTEEPYGVGIAKGNEQLVQFVDDTLTTSFTDGRYAKAWDETAGTVLGAAPAPPDMASS
jgi:glutamate transport system substrate-binding protein